MNNETYIDFCFIRKDTGKFALEIDQLLKSIFRENRLNWYLEEKIVDGAEMVLAEVKGMSNWCSEKDAIRYLEEHAGESFWEYLQGYKMFIYPVTKGCTSCGTH